MSLLKSVGHPGKLSVPRDGVCSSCGNGDLSKALWVSGDDTYCKDCAAGTLPIPDCPIVEYRWDDWASTYLVADLHVSCADHCSHKCMNWFHIRVYLGSMPAAYEECCKSCKTAHQIANRIKRGEYAFPSVADLLMMRVAELKKVRTDIFGRGRFRPKDNVRDKLLQLLEGMRGDAERASSCLHKVN